MLCSFATCRCLRSLPLFLGVLVATSLLPTGCGEDVVVPEEDRLARQALASEDLASIRTPRFDGIRAAIIEIRVLESQAPGGDTDPAAYAAHADRVTEATQAAVAVMANEAWTRDDRRLMQRMLRFGTLEELREPDDAGG